MRIVLTMITMITKMTMIKKADNDKNADNDTTSIRDDLCEGGAGGRLPLRSTSSSLMRNISIILVIEVSIFSLFLLLINNIIVS